MWLIFQTTMPLDYADVIKLLSQSTINNIVANSLTHDEPLNADTIIQNCSQTSRIFQYSPSAAILKQMLRDKSIITHMDQPTKDSTLLSLILEDKFTLAKHLLNDGATFSKCDYLLYAAVSEDQYSFDTVKFLVDNGAPRNSRYTDTVLHAAVKNNDFSKVKYLIENGFKEQINKVDTYNQTPISYGLNAQRHKIDGRIIKILVDNGADLHIQSPCSTRSPYELIVEYHGSDFVEQSSLVTEVAELKEMIRKMKIQMNDMQTTIDELKIEKTK